MLELGPGADILRGIGILMWMFIIGILAGAWALPNTRPGKYLAVATVLGLLIAFPGRWAWERQKRSVHYHARLQQARAHFQERCKMAGEKIHTTINGVNGIYMEKIRRGYNPSDPYMEDPFGGLANNTGNNYIASFLSARFQSEPSHLDDKASGNRGAENDQKTESTRLWSVDFSEPELIKSGYDYVETIDPQDGQRYRYTGSIRIVGKKDITAPGIQLELKRDPNFDLNLYGFVLHKTQADGPQPRYGIAFEDLATPEERTQWIAGSAFRVVDLQTNEVLAERIGYFMDEGMGATGGSRSPWSFASQWSCPSYFIEGTSRRNWDRNFTEQVLKIRNP